MLKKLIKRIIRKMVWTAIREKHHELDPAIFKRQSVGSLANCTACHITAEKGIYDDDDVNIPK